MQEASGVTTPMVFSAKLSKTGSASFSDSSLYRYVVGALQYAIITRPELSYSFNKVFQIMAHPLEAHWQAVKRILHYLAASAQQPFSLNGYCDAD